MKNNMLDIIIPVYNEKKTIYNALTQIEKKVTIKHNIFIIYDFNEDSTLEPVKKYIAKNNSKNIFLTKNSFNKGALNAIKTGLSIAKNSAILVTMADLSDDLDIVDEMFTKIMQGYDVVCGSRYMKGGKHIGGKPLKKFLSYFAGTSLNFFTKINTHDITNSFKMYKHNFIKETTIESTGGFEIGMELTIKAFILGKKISELPTTWKEPHGTSSRFKMWQWLPYYLKWYFSALKHHYINHKLKRFSCEN